MAAVMLARNHVGAARTIPRRTCSGRRNSARCLCRRTTRSRLGAMRTCSYCTTPGSEFRCRSGSCSGRRCRYFRQYSRCTLSVCTCTWRGGMRSWVEEEAERRAAEAAAEAAAAKAEVVFDRRQLTRCTMQRSTCRPSPGYRLSMCHTARRFRYRTCMGCTKTRTWPERRRQRSRAGAW